MADEGFKVPPAVVVVKDGKSTVYPPGSDAAPKAAVKAAEKAAEKDAKES